jgi:spore coat protein SA
VRVGYLNQPWDSGIPPDPGESIGLWTWEVARLLARSCDVLVCARRRKGEPATGTWEGVRYLRFPLIPAKADRWLSAAAQQFYRFRDARQPRFASTVHHLVYAMQAGRAFRAHACDVVHIHNFSQFVPVVRRLNPQAKIVLHMNCNWLAQLDARMIDRRLRHADAILGCSEYVTGNTRARFPHHADRCMTVYNGVNPQEFYPNGRQPNASTGGHVVFVGRISPEKGLHVLLEAFERVAARRPDVSLEVIGPEFVAPMDFIVALSEDRRVRGLSRFYAGSYPEHLRRQVRGPLQRRVSFVGAAPHHEVVERLRKADVCVVPSVWSEPFGMPAVEAMAISLPVVASRAGGLTEIVMDGETGLLAEPDNPSTLAEALLRLLEDGALARAMGRAGRQRVEQMFSWEGISETVKRCYAALCSGVSTRDGSVMVSL